MDGNCRGRAHLIQFDLCVRVGVYVLDQCEDLGREVGTTELSEEIGMGD